MVVNCKRVGDVGYVELDNPPVNAIGLSVREGLQRALEWVRDQENLERVVLSGNGRAFAAGGDAREFDGPPIAPHLPDLVVEIEASPVPWVAAITGAALGGGLEVALGCRCRLAVPGVQIGLPEVNLGVVPGAGGTQRLPRLIGLQQALSMIPAGQSIGSEQALKIGLIDGLSEDPVAEAASKDLSSFERRGAISNMPGPAVDKAAIGDARARANRRLANQIAPLKAIDLIEDCCSLSFEEGQAREREAFLSLRVGPQARALRHIFFAERSARSSKGRDDGAAAISTCAVVGGGTMGAGIAYALLNAGLKVVLIETDESAVGRARKNVDTIIKASLERKLIDDAQAASIRNRLSLTDDYSDATDVDLAIEAAFEAMDVKKTIFSALQDRIRPDAILASNTSYLDLDEIARGLDDPGRVVGLHFFAPAHIMKLLEIVRGDLTSDKALATGFALAKLLRKVPVVSGVCDGFIGNRILARYREAADGLLLAGCLPYQIDEAMVTFGYAMGPYETQDLSGLDIGFANRRRQDETRDPNRQYVEIGDRMVELGRLGRKTSAGWYAYEDGSRKSVDAAVNDLVCAESARAGVSRRSFEAAEIQKTLLLAMINEACDILWEGIAARAQDIDLVTIFGYGFPRWRGGLMHHADAFGLQEICDGLDALRADDPIAWKPSPLLRHCLTSGITLSDYRQT